MSIDVAPLYAQVVSHAKRLALFEQVLTHEPKNAPGKGLTCSIWLSSLEPVALASGLSATSLRLELSIRVYENFIGEPQDEIDKRLLSATSKLMAAYSGDFDLGGVSMAVDLLGAYGTGLRAEGGYLQQDSTIFRVVVITLPIILADVLTQTA